MIKLLVITNNDQNKNQSQERDHLVSIRMAITKKKKAKAGKDVEEKELLHPVGESVN